jgi:polyhydroxybutyrate depolymerase
MRTIARPFGSMRGVVLVAGSILSVHAVACSSDTQPTTPAAGAGVGGGSTPLAGNSSGGNQTGSAGSAGTQAGGASSSAGAPAAGGAGASAAGAGAGGNASAGSAGRGGAGGLSGTAGGSAAGSSAGGSSGVVRPSAGCITKTPRPSGGKVEVANTSLYMFPESYDGTKPFPLLIALHACGNPNTEFVNPTNNTGFATEYVRAFPNTPDSGQCWSNYSGNVARVTSQYDELMSKYCIDQNRVFAIAHSSGSQLLVNILAHKADAQHLNFKGISPVAADPFNVALPVPVLYIHGQKDSQRSADSAKNTMAKFRAANSCADTSKPYTAVMQCNSTDSGRPQVDPGCISYDGCSVPTIWCSHNDPSYSGTQHGVPCFAIKSMYDFFSSL